MLEDVKKNAEKRMQKTIETLQHELTKIRTGRANPGFLDHVQVDYYGNLTPLNQVSQVNAQDARTLSVTPWEKSMIPAIEKAILNADLGLNPVTSGSVIRVPMPALTEERRREMTKIVRNEGEQGRIAVRNVRRDANQQLKDLVKDKAISEDDERKGSEVVQKLTDKYISDIDKMLADKEKELMEI